MSNAREGATVLETSRLRLRCMMSEDVDELLRIFADPVAMQYYPSTRDRLQVEDWVRWTQDNYRRFGVGLWVVEAKDTGAFLGQCGIVPQTVHDVVEWEIGYLFVRAHWGHGYATEAARACRDHGFLRLGAPHLISLINPANTPSIAVARRNGMHVRERALFHQQEVDVYVITRAEWVALT